MWSLERRARLDDCDAKELLGARDCGRPERDVCGVDEHVFSVCAPTLRSPERRRGPGWVEAHSPYTEELDEVSHLLF